MAGRERPHVLRWVASVASAVDGYEPGEPEKRPGEPPLPQLGLGDEARDTAERMGDECSVDEAIEVVRDDEEGAVGRDAVAALDLNAAEESPQRKTGEQRQDTVEDKAHAPIVGGPAPIVGGPPTMAR